MVYRNGKNACKHNGINTINVSVSEIKAKFIGGHDKLISYLKDNSWQKIQSKNFAYLPQPSISFIINWTLSKKPEELPVTKL